MAQPAEASTGTDQERQVSAVDVLIAKCKPGMSIRAIEREAGLSESSLGNYLKPDRRGQYPKIHIIERFAAALGTDFETTAAAFAADNYRPGDGLSKDEREFLTLYRALADDEKPLAREMLTSLVNHYVRRLRTVAAPDVAPDH